MLLRLQQLQQWGSIYLEKISPITTVVKMAECGPRQPDWWPRRRKKGGARMQRHHQNWLLSLMVCTVSRQLFAVSCFFGFQIAVSYLIIYRWSLYFRDDV